MTYGNTTSLDERMRFKDDKGRVWEYEDIDKLEPGELAWEMDNMDIYVAEAE